MSNKQWHEMTTAERLRAFAFCMPEPIAKLFYEAADELEWSARKVAEYAQFKESVMGTCGLHDPIGMKSGEGID